MSAKLSIIIVNWNTCDMLAQCLTSVQKQLGGIEAEIFVVDNNSTDNSVQMVAQQFPTVCVIQNQENVGFARANNQAIRAGRSEYVLLLNSDTRIDEPVFGSMLHFMDTHQQVGVLGPMLIDGCGQLQQSWATFPTVRSELLGVHWRNRTPYPHAKAKTYAVDWLAGAALLVRRAAIDQVGLLDERFFLYSEETDWCLRMRQGGWHTVYFPAVKIVHLEGTSSAQIKKHSRYLLQHSKVLYAEKHFGRIRATFLKVGFIFLSILKALRAHFLRRPTIARIQWHVATHLAQRKAA